MFEAEAASYVAGFPVPTCRCYRVPRMCLGLVSLRTLASFCPRLPLHRCLAAWQSSELCYIAGRTTPANSLGIYLSALLSVGHWRQSASAPPKGRIGAKGQIGAHSRPCRAPNNAPSAPSRAPPARRAPARRSEGTRACSARARCATPLTRPARPFVRIRPTRRRRLFGRRDEKET